MDALKERLRALLEWSQDRWLDFRERSGFYQARVVVIAAYSAIVILTLLLAPPPPPTWSVKVRSVSFGLSHRTVIDIHNKGLGDLEDVKIKVEGEMLDFDGRRKPGAWTTQLKRLPEGTRLRIQPDKLKDKKGQPALGQIDVARIRVLEDGDTVIQWTPPVED